MADTQVVGRSDVSTATNLTYPFQSKLYLKDFPVRWSIRLLADGSAASEAIPNYCTGKIKLPGGSLIDLHWEIMKEFGFADRFTPETEIRVLRLKMLDKEGEWQTKDVTPENFRGEIRPLLDEAENRNYYGQTMYLEFGIQGNNTGVNPKL